MRAVALSVSRGRFLRKGGLFSPEQDTFLHNAFYIFAFRMARIAAFLKEKKEESRRKKEERKKVTKERKK